MGGGDEDVLSIPLDPFTADNGLIYGSTLVGKGLTGGTPAFQGKVKNGYGVTFESPFIETTTAAPTMAPLPPSKCVNDPNFSRGGKKESKKNCEEYTKKNQNKKCRLKDVKKSCPAICKMELCMCMDSEDPIKFRKEKLTCTEIKGKGLCKKKKLADKCPISCDVECLN